MKKTRTTKIKRGASLFAFAASIAFLNFACEPASLRKTDSSATETNAAAASPESDAARLEADLETMRTADFNFIYVFRRKDGGAFDGEDRKFLRVYSPTMTNRFVSSEGGRAFVAGSKFRFEQGNLDKLQERFVIEDFSKAEDAAAAESETQSAPKNSNR